jgi:hypothetical protein
MPFLALKSLEQRRQERANKHVSVANGEFCCCPMSSIFPEQGHCWRGEQSG